MYFRMPILTSDCFQEDAIVLMSKNFIEEHRAQLELFGRIIYHAQYTESLKEVMELIDADSHHDLDFSVLFGEDNDPHEYMTTKFKEGFNPLAAVDALREHYPISRLINDFGELDIEFIEEASELDYHELYPLYCKPDDEHIYYCLQHLKAVAFFEVEGCYFMGLTTSGSPMSDKLAYGYMLVDDCIPPNILELNPKIAHQNRKYTGLSIAQEKTVTAFLIDQDG